MMSRRYSYRLAVASAASPVAALAAVVVIPDTVEIEDCARYQAAFASM